MSPKTKALSFTLFADRLIDATIHPGILQNLKIIPEEWQLMAKPIVRDSQVQLVFTNQVSLALKSDCIIFSELVEQEQLEDLKIFPVMAAYLEVFSDIGYNSLSITAKSEIAFDSEIEINEYIEQKLLLSKFWQFFENEGNKEFNFRFAYPYKSGKFSLTINYNNLELSASNNHVIDFTGSFFYLLSGNSDIQKLENLKKYLHKWQIDINNFAKFIEQHF